MSQSAHEQIIKNSKFKQKFKQQKLPAWQPILTADTVLPAFFLIGLLFIPLGVALLNFSNKVQEMQIEYTNCPSVDLNYAGRHCQDVIENSTIYSVGDICTCEIQFRLNETFEKNVYMYYGLDNFYQNHRRYVKSRDDKQLYGKKIAEANSDCVPFDQEGGKIYAPCGAIANSLFNDTLQVLYTKDNKLELVKVHKTDIAWPSDKQKKFNNPAGSQDPKSDNFAFNNTLKPLYWTKAVWELDTDWSNNGYENEDLIVWMRTAAFPTFRKLYRRVDHSQSEFVNGMSQGNYTLRITFNYPVKSFGGSKRFILSTTSFLGGKNNFLGIAYIAVGSICLLLGVFFLIIHIKYGKSKNDEITPNSPYSE